MRMNDVVFTSLVVTGFTVAFLHAALPTHWLPFVVAARAQRWNKGCALAITGLAGTGHVLFTIALGALVVWGGIVLKANWSRAFSAIAGGALILVGLVYLWRQRGGHHGHFHLFGRHSHHEHHDHSHEHEDHSHSHEHEHHEENDEIGAVEKRWSKSQSDWTVIAGLFALLTFSPCEGFLPIFLTGAKYGWIGFLLLSSILAIATIAGMLIFTWLTLIGLQRLRINSLERYESLAVGLVFCVLGVIILLLER